MAKNSLIKRLGMLAIGGIMAIASSGTALGLEKKVLANSSQPQAISYTLPSEFSLKQWMTPVQSQGPYSLCYDFAAIAAIEAQLKIASGNTNYNPNLSEQQYPCYDGDYYNGGDYGMVLEFAKNTGIVEEKVLPFVGPSSSCQIPENAKRYFVKSYDFIEFTREMGPTERRETVKQALIEKGPLIADMTLGGNFDINGIYKCNGNTGGAHSVVIYGYKDTGDIHTSYWEVKDSSSIKITKIGMDWYVAPWGNFDQCGLTLDNPTSVEVFPTDHLGNAIKGLQVLAGIQVESPLDADCTGNNKVDMGDVICNLQKTAEIR